MKCNANEFHHYKHFYSPPSLRVDHSFEFIQISKHRSCCRRVCFGFLRRYRFVLFAYSLFLCVTLVGGVPILLRQEFAFQGTFVTYMYISLKHIQSRSKCKFNASFLTYAKQCANPNHDSLTTFARHLHDIFTIFDRFVCGLCFMFDSDHLHGHLQIHFFELLGHICWIYLHQEFWLWFWN